MAVFPIMVLVGLALLVCGVNRMAMHDETQETDRSKYKAARRLLVVGLILVALVFAFA